MSDYKHELGLKGLLFHYPLKKRFRSSSFWISIVITLFIIVSIILTNGNIYSFIILNIEMVIAIFPNLLGFNLGAFIFIIGFGSQRLIRKLIQQPAKNQNNTSTFQKISSIFASSLIIQAFTLLLAFIINFSSKINVPFCLNINYFIVNIFLLIFVSFFTIYSLLLVIQMIINVFTFGQMFHASIVKEIKGIDSSDSTPSHNCQ